MCQVDKGWTVTEFFVLVWLVVLGRDFVAVVNIYNQLALRRSILITWMGFT